MIRRQNSGCASVTQPGPSSHPLLAGLGRPIGIIPIRQGPTVGEVLTRALYRFELPPFLTWSDGRTRAQTLFYFLFLGRLISG